MMPVNQSKQNSLWVFFFLFFIFFSFLFFPPPQRPRNKVCLKTPYFGYLFFSI